MVDTGASGFSLENASYEIVPSYLLRSPGLTPAYQIPIHHQQPSVRCTFLKRLASQTCVHRLKQVFTIASPQHIIHQLSISININFC